MYGNSQDLVIVIVTGTASILFLAGLLIAYIYFYQKRQNSFIDEKEVLQKKFDEVLRQSQIEVQETTMSSLAKELHDNIGQLLSSTKILLGITQKNLPNVPETLLLADESLGKAINEIRALSKSLSKDWLTQFDLLQNLKTEVARINAAQILHVHLSGPDVILLSTEKRIILFRIIQEALQNAIKHAEASNIHVIIASSKELLTLKIIDDGKGFAEPIIKTGIGLTNMKQRTELLGGTITWKSSQDKGCTIEIGIQLKNNDI